MPKIEINFSDEHNDYFTLTDDSGAEYQWHCRKGIVQDPGKVLLLIRQREYPDATISQNENETALEAFDRWIAEGCQVLAVLDGDDKEIGLARIIERVPWVGTHPEQTRIIDGKKISGDTLTAMDALIKAVPEAAVLKTILLGNPQGLQ